MLTTNPPNRCALLVDGHSVAWRAFHSEVHLSNQGIPTGMALVFLRMLRAAVQATPVDMCVVTWDSGKSKFRTTLYPDYKAHREPDAKKWDQLREFSQQRELLTTLLPHLGIITAECPGWEADDLLAFWVENRTNVGLNSIIMSGDHDLWQLLSSTQVQVLNSDGKTWTTEQSLAAQFGVTPSQWLKVRVLSGDDSDNIKGVPGIGLVRALKVVKAGWPNTGWDQSSTLTPKQIAVVKEHTTVIQRNVQLMDLHLAAQQLMKEVLRKSVIGQNLFAISTPNSCDYAKARDTLALHGMASITNNWIDWLAPFVKLKAQ